MSTVLVVGSINLDLVVRVASFPAPGETIGGGQFATFPGGKGANQAVAARRLGASVSLLGCVGDDPFGKKLLQGLATEEVDVSAVRTVPGVASGVATITVCGGENAIAVAPGANHALQISDIEAAYDRFEAADVVLCQLEIPLPCVLAAAELAACLGKPFILNPAPAVQLPEALLAQTALLTPNAHELAQLFPGKADRDALLRAYAPQLLCTDGANGVWYGDREGNLAHQPAFAVEMVDSTGAGDTFNGALAAFWELPRLEAVRRAAAAAALSVTRLGAQGGMPTLNDLEHYLGAGGEKRG